MSAPTFVIFYVENPAASAAYYAPLLGREPVESSPTFVLFALGPGLMFGLWSRATVAPAVAVAGGGSELALAVGDNAVVDAKHVEWKARGVSILQEPTDMEFGRTFTVADLDGHRLRVFAPAND